ncbi:MAG: membrane protein insertion efficiency factor YidD [Actinomycetaceae bacterium]|nr:membrane protein insertion efficiency factor YidD [Actinomycetaceae bacterium]
MTSFPNPLSFVAKGIIRVYQRFISPLFPPSCKYYPSCSSYGLRAFEVHGFFKGLVLSAWRILRCNPMSDGGVDHVPLPGRWDNPWTEPGSITDETYIQAAIDLKNKTCHRGYVQNASEENAA